MERTEMVALIRDGVAAQGGTWADLGAGTGNFTWALRELIGPHGTIYAVDRDRKAIERQHASLAYATPGAVILPIHADFTHALDMPALDGVLMANALHFVREQAAMLGLVARYLRPGGRFVLVEYDVDAAIPWVPFPVPFERFRALAATVDLTDAAIIGRRRSPSSGIVMYASVAIRQQAPRGETGA